MDKTVLKELPSSCEFSGAHATSNVPATHEINEDNLRAVGKTWMETGYVRFREDGTSVKYADYGYLYLCGKCVDGLVGGAKRAAVPITAPPSDILNPAEFTAEKLKWVRCASTFVCEVTSSGKRGAMPRCGANASHNADPKRTANPVSTYPITGEALFICSDHALTLRVATGEFGGASTTADDLEIVVNE
jgi:hypothetical protein